MKPYTSLKSILDEFFDNMTPIVREHPEKLHYIEEPKY